MHNNLSCANVETIPMINWILQKNLTKSIDLERIKLALNKDNATWEEVEIIPFSDKIPQTANNDFYGSTTFMLNAFKDEELRQGVFYNLDTFQMKNYVDQWREHILNNEGQLIKFGQLNELKSNKDQSWFIRPNHDGKEFSGRVDTFQELTKWSSKVCSLGLPDFNSETEIWISKPKEIKKEWRLFIVDDKIVSACRYMKNGKLDESETDIPKEMLNFAEARIKEYRLDDVYVMDIAEIAEGFKLIECNCFNGTGFYKHDIEEIVGAVNEFMRRKTGKLKTKQK